jgi:hypothetical protein
MEHAMTRGSEPLSVRLPWEEVHRLEVLLRTRSRSLARRSGSRTVCAACGQPLAGHGMRLAGVHLHPACLPGSGG